MSRGRRSSASGFGAVGLLVAVVVMAGLGALVIGVTHNGGGAGRSAGGANVGTLSPSPGGAALDISAAAKATCRADYQAVQQAADVYTAEQGHAPGSLADLAGMLRDPVTSRYFTISVGAAGRVEVAAPGHPAEPGDGNCSFAGS